MERVYIGFPHGGKVDGAFAKSLLDLQRFEDKHPNNDYELVDISYSASLYIEENRNNLVRMAQHMKADWLLQLDGDETFDPMLLRMIMRTANKETRPIIFGLYANVGDLDSDGNGSVTLLDMIYDEAPDGTYIGIVPPDNMQPFRVAAAGAGVMLTHMSVFDKIEYPWFTVAYISPEGQDRQFMNEDICFCRVAREAGFNLWCDPLVQVTHWKTVPIMPSLLRNILGKAKEFKASLEEKK